MAVTKSSSRSEIRDYQRQLNDAGAKPPLAVDGIWGPKTQQAHDSWGTNIDAADTGDDAGALKGTGPEGTEPRFGLAGGAQLWKNTTTGKSYIVYQVPGTESDPVYMRWTVATKADVQSFFGPGQPIAYQKEFGDGDAAWQDTVDFGSSDDIANTSKSPFDSWASTLDVEAQSQPWLLDDDYQNLLAMSIIEGRTLTSGEISTTKWYRDHNEAERKWMEAYNGDPLQAKRLVENGRLAQAELMRQAGMGEVDDRLVNFVADKVTKGTWSSAEATRQIQVMSDSYFADEQLDPTLQDFLDDTGISPEKNGNKEIEVRNLVQQWLGTNFGEWDDSTVSQWAGRFRNETDAPEALIETLKDQRQALFPEYDREADYETIASPWRNLMKNMWGEVPDDSDPTFQKVIRMNDAGEAGKYLTKIGLDRGNDTTVNAVQGDLSRAFGGV